jgi:hypothetical protein
MKYHERIIVVLVCAFVYYLSFVLNQILFESLEYSYGVSWIFIPSGVQFLLVLIAIYEGAFGIFLATFFLEIQSHYLESEINFITSLIASVSPLFARKLCINLLNIRNDQHELRLKDIIKMAMIFSLVSSTFHQIYFFYIGKSEKFIGNLFVMSFGNLIGTVIVMLVFKISLESITRIRNKFD